MAIKKRGEVLNFYDIPVQIEDFAEQADAERLERIRSEFGCLGWQKVFDQYAKIHFAETGKEFPIWVFNPNPEV